MDSDFLSIINSYNQEMRENNDTEYIYTENMIKEKLGDKRHRRLNIYDKTGEVFPTLRKYFFVNYYKIYIDGVQKLVDKTKKCNICNNIFNFDSVAIYDNENNIIHAKCHTNQENTIKRNKLLEYFHENNVCQICNEVCTTPKHVMMIDDYFCHKSCCIKKIQETTNNMTCTICNEKLFPSSIKKFEYCTNKDNDTIHIDCAKKNKTIKYKKVEIHTSFNKCGTCLFYILDERKFIHDNCVK